MTNSNNNKNLFKQIYVYSIDTSAFYHKDEQAIQDKLLKAYGFRDRVKKKKQNLRKEIEKLAKKGAPMAKKQQKAKRKIYTKYQRFLKQFIEDNQKKLLELIDKSKGQRTLREESLKDTKKVGLFDSVLLRTLNLPKDAVDTKDIIIVRSYFEKVLQDIITEGFVNEVGEEYCFFSASAGQIRTKKLIMIKKSVWEAKQNTLTCGLSLDKVNEKGGCNPNKYLAYLALTNSASVKWEKFNIKRAIVVEDMKTLVPAKVDYINRDTFEIETNREMDVPIEHTDGCGMILANKNNKKAFMVRLPWMKGLLIPTPFDKFAKDVAGNTKVTDIYGEEWDIEKHRIEVIFTRSQFKMANYFSNWKEYQENFKQYKCEAAMLNVEEDADKIPDAKFNYQMLQTLHSMEQHELEKIAESTNRDIKEIGTNKEVALRVLGADDTNENKNAFQEALSIYNEMLNDAHSKEQLKVKKASLINDGKAGKLTTKGKFLFVSPDMYAFCEYLFKGDKKPQGLLANGEVFCKLYGEKKLDILRSPHLYLEHSIRKNVIDEEKKNWFVTNCIYTSIHDTISKTLQFDNDGDKLLVIEDDIIVEVADRHMKGINPLYYEMAKAEAVHLDNKVIYDSLILAYGANIGEISNKITKVFNSGNIDLDTVKHLTMINNFIIDFAKTLFMPTIPDHIQAKIDKYDSKKLPRFFMYAKGKDEKRVAAINDSTVNKLEKVIKNPRMIFKKVEGVFNYKNLMANPKRRTNKERDAYIIELYTEMDRNKKWLTINQKKEDVTTNTKLWVYEHIRRKLLNIKSDPHYIADVLVKHLYGVKDSEFKSTLWNSFGGELLINLYNNVGETKMCEDCEERFVPTKQRQVRCNCCQAKRDDENNAKRQQKHQQKIKSMN